MTDGNTPNLKTVEKMLSEAKGLIRNGATINVCRPNSKATCAEPGLRGLIDISVALRYANQGYNLGFFPGDRIVIVDIDTKHGQPGLETLETMDLPRTHTVSTPSGGLHMYYGLPHPIERHATRLDRYQGIEFLTSKQNVIMAGSCVDGRSYEVTVDIPPVMLPDYLLKQIDQSEVATFGPVEPGGEDIDEITQLLSVLDPDMGYDSWLLTGMATHHESHGSQAGYEAWLAWSKRGKKFSQKELDKKWRSFRGESGGRLVTIGTLRRMASSAAPGVFEDLGHLDSDADGWPVNRAFFEEVPEGRDWIAMDQVIRGYISVWSGAGGSAKSSVALLTALSIATGRDLLNLGPVKRGRVLVISNEESKSEFQLRLTGAMQAHGIDVDDIGGRLRVRSGYHRPILVAEAAFDHEVGVTVVRKHRIWQEIERIEFAERGFDVLVIDPLVNCLRGVNENDNGEMADVMAILRQTAAEYDLGMVAIHHANKSANGADAATRGASAIVNAARLVLNFRQCDIKDCKNISVPEDEIFNYIKLTGGKSNLGGRRGATYLKLHIEGVASQIRGELGTDNVATLMPVGQSIFDKNSSDPRAVICRFIVGLGQRIVTQKDVVEGLISENLLNSQRERSVLDTLKSAIPEEESEALHHDGALIWRQRFVEGHGKSAVIICKKWGQ